MQGARILYSVTMGGLKMKNLNEGINDSAGIDIMSIEITISLIINIFSSKKWLDNCAKYDNLVDNMQALERLTSENKKNLADKIQVLEGLTTDKT